MATVIQDLHELVFGVFLAEENDSDEVMRESLEFLGTAFFVTPKGDAITARHILPNPTDLPVHKEILGIARKDLAPQFYRLRMTASFEESDLALCKFNVTGNEYFESDFGKPLAGTDVTAFGISDHKVYGEGWELRTLKGHTTMPVMGWIQELSFPVPAGMSGGPVLVEGKCVGYLIGNIKSEELVESLQTIEKVSNSREQITFVESKQVLHFGLYRPFAIFNEHKTEVLENRTLKEFIDVQIDA